MNELTKFVKRKENNFCSNQQNIMYLAVCLLVQHQLKTKTSFTQPVNIHHFLLVTTRSENKSQHELVLKFIPLLIVIFNENISQLSQPQKECCLIFFFLSHFQNLLFLISNFLRSQTHSLTHFLFHYFSFLFI